MTTAPPKRLPQEGGIYSSARSLLCQPQFLWSFPAKTGIL